ncbi:nocturnin isoform X1 [Silurus asotus]|uniref:Nocturnin n=1 Tax=Silurus asotus TaxID=30991 RepID=A0AAD5AXQ0_SILAS|nr:nocturnin isoform X1 [Silurus asotus]
MYPVRRCSSHLAALCLSSLGSAPTSAAELKHGLSLTSGPSVSRCGRASCTAPRPLKPSRSSPSLHVSQMGSSSVRFFTTLAQPMSSTPLEHTHPDAEGSDQEQVEPEALLRECEEVLRARPPRPHRDFVRTRASAAHNPQIRVMQWNILAQALGEGKDGFIRCPMEALNWAERKYLILEEILTYRPDIVCLQEVDHYYDTFQPMMSSLGYQSSFCPKPFSPCLDVRGNNGPDGCALFFSRERFRLLGVHHLRLSALALKTNQVAVAATLQCQVTGRALCVVVTHLKARSGWESFRGAQGANLLQQLETILSAQQEAAVPLMVCGDFNAEPGEEVYRRFLNSPLGLDSAYRALSADAVTEPSYTTWKIRPSGESRATLDYVWYSHHGFTADAVLSMPTEEQIGPDRLPSYHYPSDHLSLVCDFSFIQEPHRLM